MCCNVLLEMITTISTICTVGTLVSCLLLMYCSDVPCESTLLSKHLVTDVTGKLLLFFMYCADVPCEFTLLSKHRVTDVTGKLLLFVSVTFLLFSAHMVIKFRLRVE